MECHIIITNTNLKKKKSKKENCKHAFLTWNMNGHNSQVAYKKLSVLPTPMSALTKQHLEQNQNDDKYKNKKNLSTKAVWSSSKKRYRSMK